MPKSDPQIKKDKQKASHQPSQNSPISGRPKREKDTPQDTDKEAKLKEATEEYSSASKYVQERCNWYLDWFQEKRKDKEEIEARLRNSKDNPDAANNSKVTNKELEDALQELKQILDGDDYSIEKLQGKIMSLDRTLIRNRTTLSSVQNCRDRMNEIKNELYTKGEHEKLGVKALPVLKHQVNLK